MPALTGPAFTAALLLAVAGASKAIDPAMTAGALRALGLPSSRSLVRAGAAAELLLGLLAMTAGWGFVWWLVAASYLAFAAFVVAALRAGTMVGSCGCFGREDTPPHPLHVVIDVALAATAAAAAVRGVGSPLDAIADAPGEGAVVAGLSLLAVLLLYGVLVDLPRALGQPRRS
jgi:Methylamine utilisation protein MauE